MKIRRDHSSIIRIANYNDEKEHEKDYDNEKYVGK